MREVFDRKKHRVPIKIWADEIEPGAMSQLDNVAAMPYVYHHIAAMPDVHPGFGATIGTVFGAVGALVPSAVGVDIGCGMAAVRTTIDTRTLVRADYEAIVHRLYQRIPVGFAAHKRKQSWAAFDYESPVDALSEVIQTEGRRKLGTLGGGNHFIELQSDEANRLWIMLHSGSRRAGFQIARHYIKEAVRVSKLRAAGERKELESLPLDTEEGRNYRQDMKWAQEYALENRRRMMAEVIDVVSDCLGDPDHLRTEAAINIHHNYAAEEEHFGETVWVHRKGATYAGCGNVGIIPGSMGTTSYIVEGLGCPDSFASSSHGAGRVMGRRQARMTLSVSQVAESMGDVVAPVNKKTLDEAPQAYKDIDIVMSQQADLVRPRVRLRPLAVVKGTGE